MHNPSPKIARSTKPAPLFCDLAGRTAQPCRSPAACCAPPPTSTPKPRAEGRASASGALPRADRSGAETKSFCPIARLSHPFAPAHNRSHPLQHPKRTRFRLFRTISGAFFSFCCFLAAKFLPLFLCTLLHSIYKLKPSVMPCRREVSFLT